MENSSENSVDVEIEMIKSLLNQEKDKVNRQIITPSQYRNNIKTILNTDSLTCAILNMFLDNMVYFRMYRLYLRPRFFFEIFRCEEIFSSGTKVRSDNQGAVFDKLQDSLDKKLIPDITNIIGLFLRGCINPLVFEIAQGYVSKGSNNVLINKITNEPLYSIYLNPHQNAKNYWEPIEELNELQLGLLLKNDSPVAQIYIGSRFKSIYDRELPNYTAVYDKYKNENNSFNSVYDEQKMRNNDNLQMLKYLINNGDEQKLGVYLNNDSTHCAFVKLWFQDRENRNDYFNRYIHLLPERFYVNIFKCQEVISNHDRRIDGLIQNIREHNERAHILYKDYDFDSRYINQRISPKQFKILKQTDSSIHNTIMVYYTKFGDLQ